MSHAITVLLEIMPAHLRDSHRTCRNWGEWPENGSMRTRLPIEDAVELAAADDEYDHLVPGSEIMWLDPQSTVDDQVAALISYSLEHDMVSTLRSPALADALQRQCEGWREDGRIWGGNLVDGYWLIHLMDPGTCAGEVEERIESAHHERIQDPLPDGEPCPETLRDLTVPAHVDGAESDVATLAEALIGSSIRTATTSRCEHFSELDLMLRGLASEWRIGFDVARYSGARDGEVWSVELTGLCPF